MTKIANVEDIKEMALILINAKNRELDLLEDQLKQQKKANKILKERLALFEGKN